MKMSAGKSLTAGTKAKGRLRTMRNKQRLLHLYRYLMKNTDEDHQVTTNDLVALLRKEDANVSRKTVKDDIEVLIEEGTDIVTTRSYFNAYFIGNRLFEVPEIELLANGIAANVSLTLEQKEKLIGNLMGMLSVYQAQKVRKKIVYSASSRNEQSYYNVDRITEAINEEKQIEFRYSNIRYSENNGIGSSEITYVITPYFLTCRDNRFYVIGRCAETGMIKAFRIDLINKTRILDEPGEPVPEDFSMEDYSRALFQMQEGTLTEVILKCRNEMMGEILDKFGENCDRWKNTPGSFFVKVMVCVSNAFYAWIFQHCGEISIISPVSVLNDYMDMVRKAQ